MTYTVANPFVEMVDPSYPRDGIIAADSRFMLHYTFNKRLKSDKVKNVPVDYSAYNHYYTKVHTVSLPIQSAVNLRATSGVGYTGSNVQFNYNFEDEDKNNLVAGPMRSLEVYAGVSRLKTKNFNIHLDHFSKSYFSKNEFYFLLTLSPYVDYTVYEVNEGGTFSNSYTQIDRREIDNYRRSPLGFRLGYNGTFAIWKGTAVIFGIETGKMSTIFSHNNLEHRSNMENNIFIPLYISLNFGFSFGSNPW